MPNKISTMRELISTASSSECFRERATRRKYRQAGANCPHLARVFVLKDQRISFAGRTVMMPEVYAPVLWSCLARNEADCGRAMSVRHERSIEASYAGGGESAPWPSCRRIQHVGIANKRPCEWCARLACRQMLKVLAVWLFFACGLRAVSAG